MTAHFYRYMALKCGILPHVLRNLPVGERSFLKAAFIWQTEQEAENPLDPALEGR